MTSPRQHYERDPRVDDYIARLPKWQQKICQQLRELIHAADPEVTERIKPTVQPYFVLQGNVCAPLAANDHVNLFLYDDAIVPDPEGIITAGHTNNTARTVSFRQGETINGRALIAMLQQIIANNRAGGWRKLKRPQIESVPSDRPLLCNRGSQSSAKHGARRASRSHRPQRRRRYP